MKDPAAPHEAEAPHHALLSGATVLVVEDEALLAHDLVWTIEENGGLTQGPIHRLGEAMARADFRDLDAALLDVDIRGEEIFAFADRLEAADVPMVFHTARADVSRLRMCYPDAAILYKPCLARGVVAALASAIQRHGTRSHAS